MTSEKEDFAEVLQKVSETIRSKNAAEKKKQVSKQESYDIDGDLAIRKAWLDLRARCTHPKIKKHTKTDHYLPAWESRTGPVWKSHTYVSSWSCEICEARGDYPNRGFCYPA